MSLHNKCWRTFLSKEILNLSAVHNRAIHGDIKQNIGAPVGLHNTTPFCKIVVGKQLAMIFYRRNLAYFLFNYRCHYIIILSVFASRPRFNINVPVKAVKNRDGQSERDMREKAESCRFQEEWWCEVNYEKHMKNNVMMEFPADTRR